MKKLALSFSLLLFANLCLAGNVSHPFAYDLHYTYIQGSTPETILCLHGAGGDYQIAEHIKKHTQLQESLISFNFPDSGSQINLEKSVFGSIEEILPVLYLLKKIVIEEGNKTISLYGFSAGGGAAINTLAVLNRDVYADELKKISLGKDEKKQILEAIQRGTILLDAPLKSMEELHAFRPSPAFEKLAAQFSKNDFRPIDSLKHLEGLSLTIVLNFQEPDEILSNRDDNIFIEKLKKVNSKGTTYVTIGKEGGHNGHHPSLWEKYFQLKKANRP